MPITPSYVKEGTYRKQAPWISVEHQTGKSSSKVVFWLFRVTHVFLAIRGGGAFGCLLFTSYIHMHAKTFF